MVFSQKQNPSFPTGRKEFLPDFPAKIPEHSADVGAVVGFVKNAQSFVLDARGE